MDATLAMNYTLYDLTGFDSDGVANILIHNSRAYMALRGACAEAHLKQQLGLLEQKGVITSFRKSNKDHDKDYYLDVNGVPIIVECKNAGVLASTSKHDKKQYIEFLVERRYIKKPSRDEMYDLRRAEDNLSKEYRASGLPRFEFSASQIETLGLGVLNDNDFISQFDISRIFIDLKKTRDHQAENKKRERFYHIKEFDIIAVCLFARTMRWEFLYARAIDVARHKIYRKRIESKIIISPGVWVSDLAELLQTTEWKYKPGDDEETPADRLFDWSAID